MIEEVDVEQGLPMPPSPTRRHHQDRLRQGPSNNATIDGATGRPMGWPAEDANPYEVPKQSMPATGLSKESKAMEVLGMTGVSTHVSSGRRTSVPYFHPDSVSPAEVSGESIAGIEVKRSVTVETILTPTTTGMRRTKPREF